MKTDERKDKDIYQMIAADFKAVRSNLFKELINHAPTERPTIIIADCSLIFTPSRHSDKILKHIADLYTSCYCVMVEPFNMYDVFGHFVMKYFRDYHLPLESPMRYSSLNQIKVRIQPLFEKVITVELKHAARQCISKKLYHKLQKYDLFNEYEELFHLNSHIALSLTSKGLDIPDLITGIGGNMCQCCSSLGDVEFSSFISKIPVSFEVRMDYCLFRHSSMFSANK